MISTSRAKELSYAVDYNNYYDKIGISKMDDYNALVPQMSVSNIVEFEKDLTNCLK